MKKVKSYLLLLMLNVFSAASFLHAQEKTPYEVKRIVESRNYIFEAQYVFSTGAKRMLTSDYSLIVTPDTVDSYLPYFGRAYSAPIDPTKGGIKFTSTDFNYKTEKEDDRWEIEIKPQNADQTETMYLTVFNNGRASLRVASKFRQSISFSGFIVQQKK